MSDNVFSTRLRELRKEYKLPQKHVANSIEVAQPTYALYESGKREPGVETLIKIARFFDVTSDYLLGLSETRTHIEPKGIELSTNTHLKLHLVAADLGINANALAERILKIFLLYKR